MSYGKSTLILFANRKHLAKAISWQPSSTKRIELKWIRRCCWMGPAIRKSLANCLRFNAWNHRIEYKEQFWPEFQNEPNEEFSEVEIISQSDLEEKTNGFDRGVIPHEADILTSFIDVQGKLLYWVVTAWRSSDFTGWIVDYGSWPEQPSKYYTLSKASRTLSDKYKGTGLEGRIRAGLFDLIDMLGNRKFTSLAGNILPMKAIGIDAAWGEVTSTIQSVALEHPFTANIMPCFGRGLQSQGQANYSMGNKAR